MKPSESYRGSPARSGGAKLPLVYSCSGASSAAQLANHVAVRLDRLQVAEMSCIAGVGGDVKPLVRTAQSGRPIVAIDGCPLRCVAHILRRHGLVADRHYQLDDLGVEKRSHVDFDPGQAAAVLEVIVHDLAAETPRGQSHDGGRPAPVSAPEALAAEVESVEASL